MNMTVKSATLFGSTRIDLPAKPESIDWTQKRDALPFFQKAKRGQDANWWSVKPTGDYRADFETGRNYAEQYLEHLSINAGPAMLVRIVEAMKTAPGRDHGQLDGISVGFITGVGKMFQRSIGRLALARLALDDERAREQFISVWKETDGNLSLPKEERWPSGVDDIQPTSKAHKAQGAKADPAVEAIALYWKAIDAWRLADRRIKRLSKKLPPELMRRPRVVIGYLVQGTSEYTGETLRTPTYAHTEWDIKQSVQRDLDSALMHHAGPSWDYRPKAKRANKDGYVEVVTERAKKQRPIIRAMYRTRLKENLVAFNADKTALYERQRAAGWRQAVEAEGAARAEVSSRRYKVAKVVPTTPKGAVALLDFVYAAHRTVQNSNTKNPPYGLGDYHSASIVRHAAGAFR